VAKAEPKTKPGAGSVEAFLAAVEPQDRRDDARAVCAMMAEAVGAPPVLWGPSIVGFGRYTYRYESGREGEWPLTAFSPRKANLTLYIMDGFAEHTALLARLGKHSTGKSCLYVKRLADLDRDVLRQLLARSIAHMRQTYPTA
jgi:hypothetical protein